MLPPEIKSISLERLADELFPEAICPNQAEIGHVTVAKAFDGVWHSIKKQAEKFFVWRSVETTHEIENTT